MGGGGEVANEQREAEASMCVVCSGVCVVTGAPGSRGRVTSSRALTEYHSTRKDKQRVHQSQRNRHIIHGQT